MRFQSFLFLKNYFDSLINIYCNAKLLISPAQKWWISDFSGFIWGFGLCQRICKNLQPWPPLHEWRNVGFCTTYFELTKVKSAWTIVSTKLIISCFGSHLLVTTLSSKLQHWSVLCFVSNTGVQWSITRSANIPSCQTDWNLGKLIIVWSGVWVSLINQSCNRYIGAVLK